jgi:hypothetical protein
MAKQWGDYIPLGGLVFALGRRRPRWEDFMASRSNMLKQLDVTTVGDITVENGILNVQLSVKDHATGARRLKPPSP